MTRYCAIPPVNPNNTEIGRGFGLGPGRRGGETRLHAGFDFKAGLGTPIVAPIDGVVSHKATEAQPRATTGYGNVIVLQHDIALPGLPNPFFTSYSHMRDPSALVVGQRVRKGDLIGYVGNTTNGQFANMGPHLHFEVRRRNYPSSYDRSTIDPLVLWRALGYDISEPTTGASQIFNARLLPLRGGPSDCSPTLRGLGQFNCLGVYGCPCPYCRARGGLADPAIVQHERFATTAEKDAYYSRYGTSTVGPDVDPPDYSSLDPINRGDDAGEASGSSTGLLIAGAAVLAAVFLLRR